jgi:repressor LexA
MLTKKQRDLLLYIHERISKDGITPSYDEMKDALGLHSKSGIHRLVSALEERGFLKRLPNRARAIEVLKLPDAVVPSSSNVVNGSFGKDKTPEPANEGFTVPLHGRIAAGTPIEALENVHEHITIPPEMVGSGDHYALEISGDSMVELGIMDGDRVLIKRTDHADNGDIVVALVDGFEATLKTLHKRGHQVALKPANKEHSTQILPADRVSIQGKLVGLLRSY